MVYVDTNGKLKILGPGNPMPGLPFYWDILGNSNINDAVHYIGTNSVADMIFKTTPNISFGPTERMRIYKSGLVKVSSPVEITGTLSIGTSSTQSGYKLLVEGGKQAFAKFM